jgi:hypothetical protein
MAYNSRKLYINFFIPLIGTIVLSIAGLTTPEKTPLSKEDYKFGSVDFAGRYIATLSDADFSSINNGNNPRASQPIVDKLSIIPLPLNGFKRPSAQINVLVLKV